VNLGIISIKVGGRQLTDHLLRNNLGNLSLIRRDSIDLENLGGLHFGGS